jgi:branched-chain amino acid transport system permease protein
LIIWGADIRAYTYLAFPVNLGGAVFAANRLAALSFAVVASLAFYLFLARTRLGKGIRAAAQDPATAALMGVNINQVLALCFGFGALMAGLAGLLVSMCYPINATMGLLGGLGSILGSFIGGFILGLIGAIVTYLDPGLSLAAYYLIFVLLLLLKPKGILGK